MVTLFDLNGDKMLNYITYISRIQIGSAVDASAMEFFH
jgi:hypothetical protein